MSDSDPCHIPLLVCVPSPRKGCFCQAVFQPCHPLPLQHLRPAAHTAGTGHSDESSGASQVRCADPGCYSRNRKHAKLRHGPTRSENYLFGAEIRFPPRILCMFGPFPRYGRTLTAVASQNRPYCVQLPPKTCPGWISPLDACANILISHPVHKERAVVGLNCCTKVCMVLIFNPCVFPAVFLWRIDPDTAMGICNQQSLWPPSSQLEDRVLTALTHQHSSVPTLRTVIGSDSAAKHDPPRVILSPGRLHPCTMALALKRPMC